MEEVEGKGKCVPGHSVKAVGGGIEVLLHSFSTVALDGCELSASHPTGLTEWGKIPWYPTSMRLGGHRRQSGCFGEEKIY